MTQDRLVSGVDIVRDRNEFDVLDTARQRQLPLLAICHSMQMLNVYFGGSLVPDIPRDRPGSLRHNPGLALLGSTQHAVDVDDDTVLARWLGRAGKIDVNSEHHQGIDRLAAGLRVSATAPDGLIEGVETDDGCIVGVQWHPEFIFPSDQNAYRLLRSFVDDCARAPARSLA